MRGSNQRLTLVDHIPPQFFSLFSLPLPTESHPIVSPQPVKAYESARQQVSKPNILFSVVLIEAFAAYLLTSAHAFFPLQ